ncbi:ead/Ea22-like family protein [Escherichia coli]|nr:ead/Ea22-like family protein [Escherichia coli]
MSKIDYQKLREIAEKTKIAGEAPVMPFDQRINALNDFMKHFSPDIALALLDERERNQQYIKLRDQENEEIALTVGKLRVELESAEKRIAELESGSQAQKLVEAIIVAIENEQERLFDEDYLMDSKECIDVIREEVKRWNDSRAAGIKEESE